MSQRMLVLYGDVRGAESNCQLSRAPKLGWVILLALQLCATPVLHGAKLRQQWVALQGFVYDDEGKPVQGALVSVSEGSYATQGETDFIPLIFPRYVGAIVINDPNVTKIHYYNTHFTKTDSAGHYEFKTLSPTRYTFAVRGLKKYCGDLRTHENSLVVNKKLASRYEFPPSEQITLTAGQSLTKNVTVRSRASTTLTKHRRKS